MNPKIIEQFIKDLSNEVKEETNPEVSNRIIQLQNTAEEYAGEDRMVSSLEIAEDLKTREPQPVISTGFSDLDKILTGFKETQLIVVSAATKSGKTSFCMDMTLHMKDYNPAWFPFEEPAEELIQKILDRGEQPPLFFTPKHITGNTVTWIEKKIIEARAKYDTRIVFIDHLHFIVEMGDNVSQQIGKTMRELKRIAKQWDVAIVLIAHLKKTRMEEQPTLEDLRDSSFIAQEADTVLLLYRDAKKINGQVEITNNVNVSVQANRLTGKTGNVQFVFENGKFIQKDWERDEIDEMADGKW